MSGPANFEQLIASIEAVNQELSRRAKLAVNTSLTLRNWLIGCYIEEYQLHGADRANYGDRLMDALAQELSAKGLSRCDRSALYRYRSFFLTYPQIVATLSPQLLQALPATSSLVEKARTLSAQSASPELPAGASEIVATPSPQSVDGEALLSRLSYSHFEQFVRHLVKYALAGMSNQLFVAKYQVALPSEEELRGMLEGVMR